ncbi:DUF4158 domain-containing protein [Nocardia sp. NPDC050193]
MSFAVVPGRYPYLPDHRTRGAHHIDDPACVKGYIERRETRFEHAREIQQEYGLSSFADVEAQLRAWIADQAWMTGDGPKVLFDGVVACPPSVVAGHHDVAASGF